MVWRTSVKIGCGIAGKYVVCHYCPSGNYWSKESFDANVPKVGAKEVVKPKEEEKPKEDAGSKDLGKVDGEQMTLKSKTESCEKDGDGSNVCKTVATIQHGNCQIIKTTTKTTYTSGSTRTSINNKVSCAFRQGVDDANNSKWMTVDFSDS